MLGLNIKDMQKVNIHVWKVIYLVLEVEYAASLEAFILGSDKMNLSNIYKKRIIIRCLF